MIHLTCAPFVVLATVKFMGANPKISSIPLSEKAVTEQCIGFLKAKGFLCFRLHSGTVRALTRGTFIKLNPKGTPDWIAVSALYKYGYTQTLFLEIKRSKGGKLSEDLIAWHAEARRNRLTVLVVSDFKEFKAQYDDLYKARRGDGLCNDPTVPLHLI